MTRRAGARLPQATRTGAELSALVPWVTSRQLDYWIGKGWIFPAGARVQGHPRAFSGPEKKVLRTMARLVRAGIPADMAAQVARRAVTTARPGQDGSGTASVALYGGDVVITVRDI